VLESGRGNNAPEGAVFSRDANGTPVGLAYFGGHAVIATDSELGLDDFAREIRRHRGLRGLVGPKALVEGLWERVRGWHPAPSLVRPEQPVYVLTRDALVRGQDPGVRQARESDAEQIIAQSALMIQGELGYDPLTAGTGFAGAVRRAIAAGWWWVWVVDGELRFQCNIGPRTAATAQLQGVWTPLAQRSKGYARVALTAIAWRLLDTEATLSLYVNDFNTPAIALYERLGFVRAGAFATYLFP
jgi:predicted GNAT family acetyltransferase